MVDLLKLEDLQDPIDWRYVSTICLAIFCGDPEMASDLLKLGLRPESYITLWLTVQ